MDTEKYQEICAMEVKYIFTKGVDLGAQKLPCDPNKQKNEIEQ
jgi:hypothetical protein